MVDGADWGESEHSTGKGERRRAECEQKKNFFFKLLVKAPQVATKVAAVGASVSDSEWGKLVQLPPKSQINVLRQPMKKLNNSFVPHLWFWKSAHTDRHVHTYWHTQTHTHSLIDSLSQYEPPVQDAAANPINLLVKELYLMALWELRLAQLLRTLVGAKSWNFSPLVHRRIPTYKTHSKYTQTHSLTYTETINFEIGEFEAF